VRKLKADFQMAKVLTEDRLRGHGSRPLKVAIAVAVLGVLGMLIVDHGPWNKPKVQPAFMASSSSTGEAAPGSRRQGHADRTEAAGRA
jgi:hypothetical protein